MLLKQAFVMNPDQTIIEQLDAKPSVRTWAFLIKLAVYGFTRLALGEVERRPKIAEVEVRSRRLGLIQIRDHGQGRCFTDSALFFDLKCSAMFWWRVHGPH